MNYKIKEIPAYINEEKIYGKAYIPESGNGKAVILSHGYNSSHADLEDAAKALAENGAFAYCFDFRGGSVRSKSDGSPSEMSIKTEIADLKKVIETVKTLDSINIKEVYLYGESQGGFVSALTAADIPNEINGIVLLYPAFCIPDDWNKMYEKDKPEKIDLMGMTLSKKFFDELPDYDVFEHIKRYGGRTAIIHGTADGLVSPRYSEKAAKCFPNAELFLYEDEGHGFSPAAREKLVKLVCKEIL